MDFKAVQILCMAVSTLIEEISWDEYGPDSLHTPLVRVETDCHKLHILMDILGTLTRMMDTRIAYVNTEGKIIREWIESILEIGQRYKRELEVLKTMESRLPTQCLLSDDSSGVPVG